MRLCSALAALILCHSAIAAEVTLKLPNAPASGPIVVQVYDDAARFGNFRDPATEITLAARGPGDYELGDLPVGDIALLVYVDENGNGRLDRNFIGIPKETLGLSNNYRPKGPPTFDRARVTLTEVGADLEIEMFRVLGNLGRLGVGAGIIGRSSPYVDSSEDVIQPIPTITYNGERLQWFGPTLRYGLVGTGATRLALAADYRVGTYEDDDADILAGLGDREDTLLLGLSTQFDLPRAFDLAATYQHDVLDNIGGGQANVALSRNFQWRLVRLNPQVQVNWVSEDLADHDFGVPVSGATPGRPAYGVGSYVSYEVGFGSFIELTEDWRIIFNLSAEFLPDDVTDSPIVEKSTVLKGFAALNYVF